jgi:ssDNA-binding Zn-finger/Zn-ribbon topoisomerase 1
MPRCPLCSTNLVWKRAANGGYLGCPNYPGCTSPLFDRNRAKSIRPHNFMQQPNPDGGCFEPPSQQEFDQALD